MQGFLDTGNSGDSGEGEVAQVHEGHQAIQAECHHRLRAEGEPEGLWLEHRAADTQERQEEGSGVVRVPAALKRTPKTTI